ncbi:DMT family transporter [Methanolobus sp. ZRKC2]|uniref:DMT family transporter n=1 Tax=Methanolobus sp. ZRKC2 TaxID=3125783 RepID=UPI00324A5FA4
MDLESLIKEEHKRKAKKGYMWALICALLWGIWYIPGTVIWVLNPFDTMYAEIAPIDGDSTALFVTAILITALTALTVMIGLTLWNLVTGKFGEIYRTTREFRPCSIWFFLAAICGGPIAILGSYMAMGFVGGAFAAVASLLFPIVSSILASKWYGEKISRRAALGIFLIVCGGIAIYAGGLLSELATGNVRWLGYVGGLMAAVGWGAEGAVAGKGLDLAEPDVGLTIRFFAETVLWWILIIPILVIIGYPMIKYTLMALDPMVFMVLMFAGLAFGYCYVALYKALPLIGVGRGQGVANLYGLCAVIFIMMFFGDIPSWTLLLGAFLCLTGSTVMYTEEVSGEALRAEGTAMYAEKVR